ncbi:MAG: outer membrane protein transport protein [Candidatus Cloacimonetes bacterium]|jgi:long-chain fatty acid transport protein|nr:outer membrane protein transport protein [Candidatus Cloacimonadota bacterium]MDD2505716.1 outer membrane protein transport protein [Candidatus Cloacimonadota bacterium]MDD4147983.1 outer membrane protein transport protein [Candidatus Cloacimonadota bacterium]MDD4559138.1 outer membrane protein transport protein [Candidatus Cloacimonadota bacterium]
MKQIHNVTVLLCMVLVTGQLFASGFGLTGVGSRATSMGGAFRGLSDDASAMYWNPAGLGFMNENSVSLGGTFIMPSAKWDPSGTTVASIPGFSAKEYEAKKKVVAFPNAFLTMAKNPRFKYGLGVYVPYGLGTTWDAYDLPSAPYVYNDAASFPDEEMMSSIAVVDIHPSAAYQILPNLSVGMGISAMYGMIDITQLKFPSANVAPMSIDLSGTGIGFGANMGVLYKPTYCLAIGLSGKLPSSIDMEGDIDMHLWAPANPDGTPAMKLGGKSDIDATLDIPGDIGIGLACTRFDNLTLTLDYSYTMWDALETVKVKIDDPIVIADPANPFAEVPLTFNWENTHRVSLGAEYMMGIHRYRMGFFYDQTPIPEDTQIPTLSDISDKFSSNIGWGIDLGNIGFEANAQWVMFTEREIKDTQVTEYNMPGKYSSNSISGNIGLSYRF